MIKVKKVSLLDLFIKSRGEQKSGNTNYKLASAFNKIKDEMNEHLEAINENTSEINSVHEYTALLESMIQKLGERLDGMEMKLFELSGGKVKKHEDITLTPKEHEIFLLLYSRNGDLMDYKDICRSLGLTEELARRHVSGIVGKGIPIVHKYFENKIFLVLDPDFRNLQAKENIVKVK